MGCSLCKKKGIPIDCKYCLGKFCSRCINLEQHNCKGIEDYKKFHRENLQKQLAFEPKSKVISL